MDVDLNGFFAAYAARMNRGLADPPVVDVEPTMGAFADCFVEASPLGVSCAQNGDAFRAQIPKGLEFYRSIGTKSMLVTGVDVTPIDDLHAIAKVGWRADYVKPDGSPLTTSFDVTYFIQDLGQGPKIFGFVAGDESKFYRENGLLPAKESSASR